MKVIISPAKTLDLKSHVPQLPIEKPILENQAQSLISTLKKLSPSQIGKLMSISPQLAELNYNRFQEWKKAGEKMEDTLRPAVFMFQGDVYQGIDPYHLTISQVKKMNDFTYILSGLYGILKPLTLIRPYRLEMGTSLKNSKGNDLYQFWGDTITSVLNKDLTKEKNSVLINLASAEYYHAIQPHLSSTISIIHPVFLDQVKGSYRIVSFYAKKARGMMVRFLIGKSSPQNIKQFNTEGYHYSEEETANWNQKKFPNSKKNSTMVFLRESRP